MNPPPPPPTVYALLITYTAPMDRVDAHTADHRAYLDRWYASGHLLVSGRRSPPVGGVVIARFASPAELAAFVAGDPFVIAGVAAYETLAFAAAKHAPEIRAWLQH
jgi:uncharacterized protein YciI